MAKLITEVTTTYEYNLEALKTAYSDEWQEVVDDLASDGFEPDRGDEADFVLECFFGEGARWGGSDHFVVTNEEDSSIDIKPD